MTMIIRPLSPAVTSSPFLSLVLRVLLVVLTAILFGHNDAAVIIQPNKNDDNMDPSPTPLPLQCDMYLAESTIPNAGLGIFSGIEKQEGDFISNNGDVCIPLIDMKRHNNNINNINNNNKKKFFSIFHDYVWDGWAMGMELEAKSEEDVKAYCPGIDCAVNCNLALLNVETATPPQYYDKLQRSNKNHPGAGAITPYHNGTTIASRYIPIGGELFKYYGDTWFTTRPKVFGNIPLYDDYELALFLLKRIATIRMVNMNKNNIHRGDDNDEKQNQQKNMRRQVYNLLLDLRDTVWKDNSRILNALPDSWNDGIRAINANDMGVIAQPNATRSIEWLQQHGKCVDHIVPGQYSTIPGAGRGAFAKRDLPAGTVITGTPLHHVPNRNVFHMYRHYDDYDNKNLDDDDGNGKDSNIDENEGKDHHVGQQVMLNYCFGHSESTLLLCPYGSGIGYINHNKTLANVKIAWSQHGSTSHNNSWLSIPPKEMEWQYKTNLAFDFIATRDIVAGEELFLDYGDDWEEAWHDHVRNWEYYYESDENNDAKEYKSARQYNAMFGNAPLRTEHEQKTDPYPENLSIRCHSNLLKKKYKSSAKDATHLEWNIDDVGYPCKILRRYDSDQDDDERTLYDVAIKHKPKKKVKRFHVPREGLTFADVPYSTDIHLLHAFRHPISIPDDLMPDIWKNVVHGQEETTPLEDSCPNPV